MKAERDSAVSSWAIWGYLPVAAALLTVWIQSIAFAQSRPLVMLNTGRDIFLAGCTACHGPDGKGQPQTTLGFEPPSTFPDFTDCPSTTPEPDQTWKTIITDGGPSRGFSEIMPSFKETLTSHQIDLVVGYLRGLCRDKDRPRGELNLPRPLITEKAYPENETVVTTAFNATQAGQAVSTILYEQTFGAKTNVEIGVPFSFVQQSSSGPQNGRWYGGVGDLALAVKRVLFHDRNNILSAAEELHVPTGNKTKGFGDGVTVLETFLAYARILPANSFVQFHTGVELPTRAPSRRGDRPRSTFWRTAVGKTFTADHGFGRAWSPMVEFIADRDWIPRTSTNWDIVPQMQVTINKRQHIRANFGVQIPMNKTRSRAVQIAFYLLWDWFDGGIADGWK